MTWRTIDSAPKDQHILLYGKIDPDIPFDGIHWENMSVFSGYWDAVDDAWTPHGATWLGPFMIATHWMPLPTPPET